MLQTTANTSARPPVSRLHGASSASGADFTKAAVPRTADAAKALPAMLRTRPKGTKAGSYVAGPTQKKQAHQSVNDGNHPTFVATTEAEYYASRQAVHDVFTPLQIQAQQQHQAHIIGFVAAPLLGKFTSQAVFETLSRIQAAIPTTTPDHIQAQMLTRELESVSRPWYAAMSWGHVVAGGLMAFSAFHNLNNWWNHA